MKTRRPTLALLSILAIGPLLSVQPAAAQTPPKTAASTGGYSAHETTSEMYGDRRTGNRVTITYGRPSRTNPRSKDKETRVVWGKLVEWEKANRLGADEATLLLTQKPLMFGNVTIPAGAHTLYLVPSEKGTSMLAFSSNIGKWGVPVDETKDVGRVPLKKETIADTVELLTIKLDKDAGTGGGVLRISWENTQFSAPFTFQADSK